MVTLGNFRPALRGCHKIQHIVQNRNMLSVLYGQFPNKNALVRDGLSTERSFLAYTRSAVTIVVSAFSITQIALTLLIQQALNNTGGYNAAFHSYNSYLKPVCLLLCALGVFVLCTGLKRMVVNLYHLTVLRRFQPGYIGMGIFFVTIFIANVIILRQCIVLGINELGFQ